MTKKALSALGEKTDFGGRRGLMLVLSSPSGAGWFLSVRLRFFSRGL